MIQIRRAADRGRFDHGWLDTRHTFSFGEYHDPRQMGFRSLRVINEDRVRPGQGFGTHGHRDMEIISYVLEGGLAHKDSMGNGSVITPGDVQYMSAGTGVRHSEFNASQTEPVHFYQIWILPNADGQAPQYGQKRFDDAAKRGRLRLVASGPEGAADGAIGIRQDARIYASVLDPGQAVTLELGPNRHLWTQVLRGSASVNGHAIAAGDGLAASSESQFRFEGGDKGTELLVFDLA
ncbi:MAG TPA: pirin family protein [Thermoanaerobaculia bacterium]|nr:pirin family protein [Thermoanaerobaculia bacterium]